MYQSAKKPLAALAISLLCTSCSSTSKPPAEPVPYGPDGLPVLTDAHKAQGIVCKRVQVVGSRISRKTCITAEQRENSQRLAREEAEQMQRASKAGGPDGG